MNFTVKQLRAFATVADTGNFRAASEMLYLSPAAVSLLVRELEVALGFNVFERTTRRVILSRPGKEFLPAAQRLLRELSSTELTAREVQARSCGTVRVAAPLVIASLILPGAIADFQRLHRDISVRPVDSSLEDLVHLVEDDQAEFAMGADRPTGVGVSKERLYETPWMLWCSREHPLAAARSVCWQDLHDHPVIAPGREFEARITATLHDQTKVRPFTPAYVVSNITTALGLASAGLGVTVAPSYVEVIANVLGLVGKELRDPAVHRELVIFKPAHRALSESADAFLRFAIHHFQNQHLRLIKAAR